MVAVTYLKFSRPLIEGSLLFVGKEAVVVAKLVTVTVPPEL